MTLVDRLESLRASAKDYIGKVAAKLKQKGIEVKTEVREAKTGNAAEEVIRLADEINADVVAMSTHGESSFSRWVLGSVAEKVLQGGNTPLLLVRASGASVK